jgi:hypothetical protein
MKFSFDLQFDSNFTTVCGLRVAIGGGDMSGKVVCGEAGLPTQRRSNKDRGTSQNNELAPARWSRLANP